MKSRRVMHRASLLALIFVIGWSGCTGPDDEGRHATSASALATKPDPSSAYAQELAKTEKQIQKLQKVVEGRQDDWLMRQQLASALLDKASLTGQVADYKEAEKVIEEIFAIGEVGFAPKL